MAKEQIGVISIDPEARTVDVEFNEAFFQKTIDDQAAIACALLEKALYEHVEAQDARIDALTGASEPDLASVELGAE